MRAPIELSIPVLSQLYASGHARPHEIVATIYECVGSGRPDWIHLRQKVEAIKACDALEERRKRGETLPLFGIPFGVKDNIDVAGMPTTAACEAFGYIPARSARCVELLVEAGAICIGKNNLDQFATGLSGARSPYGPCSSIGNPLYISGGSSSGSAVAVAAGHVSFSLGTDTGGSGRIPAGFNNIVGVKPTVGRISTRGLVPNCPTIDCPSVFSLTVEDGLKVLEIMDGYDPEDPYARRAPARREAWHDGPFRFGVLAAKDRDWCGMAECGALYEAACKRLLEIGGTPVEVDFAPFREAGQLLFDGPWIAERRAALDPIVGGKLGSLLEVTRAVLETAKQYDAQLTFTAVHRLLRLRRDVEMQFESFSVLVVPTAPRPFTIAEMNADPIRLNNQLGRYSYFANLLDLCGIAVPSGVLSSGVPMGITLLAPAWQDERVAGLASRFLRERGRTQPELVAVAS